MIEISLLRWKRLRELETKNKQLKNQIAQMEDTLEDYRYLVNFAPDTKEHKVAYQSLVDKGEI